MLSVVSIILVLIGWKVTYYNSSKLATRSESKALIDSLSKLINEIADSSIDFWLNKSQNGIQKKSSLARSHRRLKNKGKVDSTASDQFVNIILAKTRLVYRYLAMLQERNVHINQSLIGFLVEKSTLECELAYQMDSSERTIKAQEIIDSAMAIIDGAYTSFQITHPPSKPLHFRKQVKKFFENVEKWHNTYQ